MLQWLCKDSLINRKVNDWDITTNAKPEDTINIFKKQFQQE